MSCCRRRASQFGDLAGAHGEAPSDAHAVEQPSVVTDQYERAGVRLESLLELLDRRQVEVVGGLVEHEQVHAAGLQQRERRAGPLPGRERRGGPRDVGGAEAELREQGPDVGRREVRDRQAEALDERLVGQELPPRLGKGDHLAFFYYFGLPEEEQPGDLMHRSRHLALHVDTERELLDWRARLKAHGVRVTPPLGHELLESIYFDDPNGIQLEITRPLRPFAAIDARDAELTLRALSDVTRSGKPTVEEMWRRKGELSRAHTEEEQNR